MRFIIDRQDIVDRPNVLEVALEHNGQKINWSYRFSTRPTGQANAMLGVPRTTPADLYAPLNDFLETLAPDAQNQLFGVYSRIRDVLAMAPEIIPLMENLKPLVAEMYTIIKLDDIARWASVNNRIHVPADVEAIFQNSDETSYKREITYTIPEYYQLLVFAVALRAMMPIWGHFIDYITKLVSASWKEFYAYKLLAASDLQECPPMLKLRTQINYRFQNTKPENFDAAVLEFVSRDEIPEWLVSLMVVKKVATAEIDYRNLAPTRSLVKIIYNSVKELLDKPAPKFLKGFLKEKSPDAGNVDSDGQGKNSILEAYKIPVEIIPGDQAVLNAYALQVDRMVAVVQPDLPPRILQQAMKNVEVLKQMRIFNGQRAITALVLHEAMPAMASQFIVRNGLLSMTAVAQAVLWYRGHRELASLLTAVAVSNDFGINVDPISPMKLSKEMRAELDRIYPYARTIQQGRDRNARQPNDGIQAIDAIVDALCENSWRLTIPKSWMDTMVPAGDSIQARSQAIPPDIRNKLALLAIDLDNRRQD